MSEREPVRLKSFKDLRCWQEAHQLALMIYEATRTFPSTEQYGLTNQMRRAAVSVSSNIAEGFNRSTRKEKAQFYTMARGSTAELQSQSLIARDIGYIQTFVFEKLESQAIVVHKLLGGLIRVTRSPRP